MSDISPSQSFASITCTTLLPLRFYGTRSAETGPYFLRLINISHESTTPNLPCAGLFVHFPASSRPVCCAVPHPSFSVRGPADKRSPYLSPDRALPSDRSYWPIPVHSFLFVLSFSPDHRIPICARRPNRRPCDHPLPSSLLSAVCIASARRFQQLVCRIPRCPSRSTARFRPRRL